MIPKTLVLLIAGLFIAWIFNSYVGMVGLFIVLTFYWIVYLRALKVSREKILKLRDAIVERFHNFNGNTGEEHFNFLYSNSHHYINFQSSTIFAIANFLVKLGSIMIGLYSVWKSDWISIIICILFGFVTTILSSKFEKHHKFIISLSRLNDDEYEKIASTLNSYTQFFKETFPDSYNHKLLSNRN